MPLSLICASNWRAPLWRDDPVNFAHITIRNTKAEPARAFAQDYGLPALRIIAGGFVIVIEQPGMTQAQADMAADLLNDIFAARPVAPALPIAAE